jgi:hypothetical protein
MLASVLLSACEITQPYCLLRGTDHMHLLYNSLLQRHLPVGQSHTCRYVEHRFDVLLLLIHTGIHYIHYYTLLHLIHTSKH